MREIALIYFMLRRNLLLSVLLVVVLLLVSVGNVYATTTPSFPACANPQGEIKASYDSGTHGVAGDGSTYSGKDTVYTLSDNTLTQCLCTDNGRGIQTNWWKASSFTQEEKDVLINQGWILITSGLVWGLDDAPYLAQNLSYTCTSSNQVDSEDIKSDNVLNRIDVQSAELNRQEVFNLASTGNIVFILAVVLFGLILLTIGAASSFKRKV